MRQLTAAKPGQIWLIEHGLGRSLAAGDREALTGVNVVLYERALAPLASAVTDVNFSPRGAWQVVLESGLTLEVGRADVEARLQRFAAAWPQLASAGVASRHADLRYANGFALRTARAKP